MLKAFHDQKEESLFDFHLVLTPILVCPDVPSCLAFWERECYRT